jgi:hypothetical protein
MPINNFSAMVKTFSNEQLIMNCLILLMGTITALTQKMGKVDGRELENTPFADALMAEMVSRAVPAQLKR